MIGLAKGRGAQLRAVWRLGGTVVIAATLLLSARTVLAATTTAPLPGCSYAQCAQATLDLLNRDRAAYRLPPLILTGTGSIGAGACVGAYGHSVAMAESGSIWHTNGQYPNASFPRNICGTHELEGEAVGESAGTDIKVAVRAINALMMREPHDASTCATTVNHACIILNRGFHRVGIGLYYAHGAIWLTEDFTS